LTDNMIFRPYGGIEAANTSYGAFKESGAGIYNLDVKEDSYLRSAARVGIGLDYERDIWIWYANLEGKYVFDGIKPEIKSEFVDTDVDFYSRGAKEGNIQAGAGAGAEVRITENWKAFANIKYYIGERYDNLYGNVGIRYLFGSKEKAREKAEKAAALEAQRKAEEAAALEQAKLEAARIEQERLEQARLEKQAKLEQAKLEAAKREQARLEQEKLEEAKRIAEEAKITKEISDEDLAKQKAEAEERRKRPMLKTYSLTTNFRINSYFLSEEFKEQIKAIVNDLKKYEYKKITIEGHTDSTGSKELNKKLSRQRARSVYDEFIKAGVSKEKINYAGFADSMPIKSNKTKEGRSANRRTEIFIE